MSTPVPPPSNEEHGMAGEATSRLPPLGYMLVVASSVQSELPRLNRHLC